jgi:protease-4
MSDTVNEPQNVSINREVLDNLGMIAAEFLRERRAEQRWRTFKRLTWVAVFIGLAFVQFVMLGGPQWFPLSPPGKSVAVISISGEIATGARASADTVVPLIVRACREKSVDAVILDIDSPGGSPAEAERMANALGDCRTEGRNKRIIAVANNLDASAAYLLSVHADEIIANRYSLVGSIGAIMTSWDGTEGLARLGVTGRVYASGPNKAMGMMSRHDTAEQSKVAQQIVDGAARLFREEVQAQRGKKLKESSDMYSGRIWNADEALALGLIDRIDVLDHVLAVEFPNSAVQRLVPHRPLSESMSFHSFTKAMADDLVHAVQHNDLH